MKLIAKTLYGLEGMLTGELRDLGATNPIPVNRAVIFDGDQYLLYKANYCLRTAVSILAEIAEFRIRSPEDLYRNSLQINWMRYLGTENTFSVIPVVKSTVFTHSGYAGLRLKDAIADWFRNKTGRRPSVDTNDPDIVFNLHISHNQVTVSLDSSVVPLFKRGYRKEHGQAPMNEVLAAGIILLSGWTGKTPLIDPMCGSGTIAIEAGLIVTGIFPGNFRQFFGFQRWPDYNKELFNSIRIECNARSLNPGHRVFCSDISENAVIMTRRNIESAGLSEIITVEQRDFSTLEPSEGTGILIMNPPYGERLKSSDIESLYSMIGSTLKHNFTGYQAFLISSDKTFLSYIGLKPKKKTVLYNGPLECLLVKYELYEGSRKRRYNN